MGVQGLTTFLSSYKSKYGEKSILRSQLLLIDGSNLMYILYFKHNRQSLGDHLFGGNYATYVDEIRTFFDQLTQSKIQPIVIFDGALEKEKFRTMLKRFGCWLQKSFNIDVDHIYPTNMQHSVWVILHTILDELNVPQFQTEWEADDTIALVAKELGCPVLSCDSDFYIYEGVKVIGWKSLSHRGMASSAENWRDSNTRKNTITGFDTCFLNAGKIWRDEFGIGDVRLLSLGSCLIGNDYIEQGTFSRFVSHMEGNNGKAEKKWIGPILKWLGRQESFEVALKEVLDSIKLDKQERVKEKILFVMKSYMGGNGEVKVLQRIQAVVNHTKVETQSDPEDYEDADISDILDQQLSLKEGDTSSHLDGEEDSDEEEEFCPNLDLDIVADSSSIYLPPWFMELYLTCQLPDYLIKIAYNKLVVLYPQFEIETAPPSQSLSIPIIQYTAGLILGIDSILLVTHEGKSNLKKVNLPTILQIPPDKVIPYLRNMETLPIERRSVYLLKSLGLEGPEIDFVYRHPAPVQLSVACLLYFVKGLKSPSSVGVALAVMISSLEQFVGGGGNNKELKEDNWRSSRILTMPEVLGQASHAKSKTVHFYKKFLRSPDCKEYNFREGYDKRRVYDYTQYKCVLYHAAMLNKVLLSPLVLGEVPDCYLIYNVTTRLCEMEYKFMDFIRSNFEPGFGEVLQDFVQFVCKMSGVHLNGYFVKGKGGGWRDKKPEGKKSSRFQNRFASLGEDRN